MLPICYKKRINDWKEELYTFHEDRRVSLEITTNHMFTERCEVGNWKWSLSFSRIIVDWKAKTYSNIFLSMDELKEVSSFYEKSIAKVIVE